MDWLFFTVESVSYNSFYVQISPDPASDRPRSTPPAAPTLPPGVASSIITGPPKTALGGGRRRWVFLPLPWGQKGSCDPNPNHHVYMNAGRHAVAGELTVAKWVKVLAFTSGVVRGCAPNYVHFLCLEHCAGGAFRLPRPGVGGYHVGFVLNAVICFDSLALHI